ncbi:MAG TPA: amidohydrolase family protein [Bryobacteraceae bacterium]|nr:amidohydrolase family protein [Bryobacteraceae bacterium]
MPQRTALFVLLASTLLAQTPTRVVIRAGTLLDGKGGVEHNRQIVIENGRIHSIGPARGRADYDLDSATVMPGWIDTHVHLNWHFDANHKNVSGRETPEDSLRYTAANAKATVQGGFTTVQSVGAAVDATVRDKIAKTELEGPRILTSYRQIQGTAGDPDALRALVRRTKADGADLIKLFATSGLGAGGNQTMTDEQIRAVCSEAKAIGLRTLVHAIGDSGAKASVLASCTAIEHGTFVEDATLDLMAQHGTYFDPNFLVLHNYIEDPASFNFNEDTVAKLKAALEPTAALLQRARAHHVKVVLGTDAVSGAPGRNAEEFIYRVNDGHDKPMDALISGTSLAAESLGMGKEIGMIAAGYQADLVATDGNPLDDITAVRRVVFVMRGGAVYRNTPASHIAR